jgi:hypothetical protein
MKYTGGHVCMAASGWLHFMQQQSFQEDCQDGRAALSMIGSGGVTQVV